MASAWFLKSRCCRFKKDLWEKTQIKRATTTTIIAAAAAAKTTTAAAATATATAAGNAQALTLDSPAASAPSLPPPRPRWRRCRRRRRCTRPRPPRSPCSALKQEQTLFKGLRRTKWIAYKLLRDWIWRGSNGSHPEENYMSGEKGDDKTRPKIDPHKNGKIALGAKITRMSDCSKNKNKH